MYDSSPFAPLTSLLALVFEQNSWRWEFSSFSVAEKPNVLFVITYYVHVKLTSSVCYRLKLTTKPLPMNPMNGRECAVLLWKSENSLTFHCAHCVWNCIEKKSHVRNWIGLTFASSQEIIKLARQQCCANSRRHTILECTYFRKIS